MSGVTFADILFILLTCIVIAVILWLVNRGKNKVETAAPADSPTGDEENQP